MNLKRMVLNLVLNECFNSFAKFPVLVTGVLLLSSTCQSMILGVFEHLPIIVLSTLLYTFPIFRVFLYSDAIDVKKKRMIKEIELEL